MNSNFRSRLGGRLIVFSLFATMIVVCLVLSMSAGAQPSIPDILPDGVDSSEKNPVNIIVFLGQYFVAFLLWVGVLALALKVIWEAIGDVKDAKNGDTKWIAAGKSIAGGIFFFLLVLALALWITNQFLN